MPKPTRERATVTAIGELSAPSSVSDVTQEEIAIRAYDLYSARGYEDGHDLDDWLQAERELRETRPLAVA